MQRLDKWHGGTYMGRLGDKYKYQQETLFDHSIEGHNALITMSLIQNKMFKYI